MPMKQVRAQINGTWVTLTLNSGTGKYEGTIAAPNVTSWNVNAGHYYPVTIEAEDLAGNKVTANDSHTTLGNSLRLKVKEITKPTITMTAPSASAYLATNTPTISFQLRDETNGSGINISTLSLKLDSLVAVGNTATGMTVTQVTGGYNVSYTTPVLGDGNHTVTINISDNDGNAATAVSRTFKTDTIPPTLEVTNPSVGTTYVHEAAFTVSGQTSDVTSSPVTLTIKRNTIDVGAVVLNANGTFTKSITLTEGSNTIVIRAQDLAGKFSEITRNVILDTVLPTIESITIAPNPVNVGASYKITVEATD